MKKLIGVTFLVLQGFCLFAQKANYRAPLLDSVKAKTGKIRLVNGAAMSSANDIVENVSKSKDHSLLLTAIANAGLTETFKSKGPITIFAPNNKAFENMPPGKWDTLLMPVHKFELSHLVAYHAVAGRLTAKDIAKKINANKGIATFTTIAGTKLTAKINANRNIVLVDENGGESVVSQFDIPQSNGMLHIVNAVLIPKVKEI